MSKNKIKLIVVDDSVGIRESISYYFQERGYIVFTAASGKEALVIIKQYNPDIMLLDFNLG